MTRFIGEPLAPYPRSDRVRRLLRRLEETGEASSLETMRAVVEESLKLVGVQLGAGVYSVTYPGIEWHDLLRPFIEAWRGVYYDGLARWFDNNFFYRVPVFVELPDAQRLVLPGVVRVLTQLAERVRVYLPGPLTITRLSSYRGVSADEVAARVAELLGREAKAAVEAGASIVEVHEPFLGDIDAKPEDAEALVDLLRVMLGGVNAEKRLVTYYSPPRPEVWARLKDAPVDMLVIDYVDAPDRAREALSRYAPERLGVGLVNARNIYPEDVRSVAEKAGSIAAEYKVETLAVYTSAPLDLIPLRYAIEKTRIVGFSALLAG